MLAREHARAALHALNLPRLREQLSREIKATNAPLRAADAELRVL